MKKVYNLMFSLLLMLSGQLEAQNITKIEYFVDNDPGFGNATDFSITPSPTVEISTVINLTGYGSGFHELFIRAQDDNGKWSLVQQRNFYKTTLTSASIPDISQVEYFIDNDPGYGNGTIIAVSASPVIETSVVLDITSLSVGFHQLFLRAKDSEGRWSLVQQRNFYKSTLAPSIPPDIVEIEYFVDNDPGFGLAIDLPINMGPIVDSSILLTLPPIDTGDHVLYMRAKDGDGNWSLIAYDDFRIELCETTYSSIDVSACIYYRSPSEKYTYFFSEIFNDTISNAAGCDSVITIDLTIVTDSVTCAIDPCAQDTINLDFPFLNNDPHQSEFIAIKLLTANGFVTSSNMEMLEFKAGESIELMKNFEVELGATLLVDIYDCGSALDEKFIK